MATKREFLVEKGLAKPGRGRFSTEAKAALATAEAEGVVFDEPVKAEKPAKVETDEEPAPSRPSLPSDAQKVREWARAQGIEVGERGRIPAGVTAAYNGAPLRLKTKGVVASIPAAQVRVRDFSKMRGITEEGWTIEFSTCSKCAEPICYCACKAGPKWPFGVVALIDGTRPI
jgi:hypothetical protein